MDNKRLDARWELRRDVAECEDRGHDNCRFCGAIECYSDGNEDGLCVEAKCPKLLGGVVTHGCGEMREVSVYIPRGDADDTAETMDARGFKKYGDAWVAVAGDAK